ncbi:Arginyl-tRNA synthetase [hydrothermal vent metagenome]|uniref:arginine--tRNA ligase n=1 Tax=hydrothermal vent metagenome TaxID=652676 RepID=A0A3B0WVF3_9ZZZZ
MKNTLQNLLQLALDNLKTQGIIATDISPDIQITRTKDKTHGDFACNLALMLAKPAKKNPRELAQCLIDALPEDKNLDKVEIAGPGFINFFISQSNTLSIINTVNTQAGRYGLSDIGAGRKVQIEFVSANPTGPLHVGHGRGAAYGATVASLLKAIGFDVQCEYYVNDAGRQMDILGTSVWLRYLEHCGENITFPSNAYKGEYVKDIAEQLFKQHDKTLMHPTVAVFENIPADEPTGGDKDVHIDALINRAKSLLGHASYRQVFDLGLNLILEDIRNDLSDFGVEFDEWYSERSLEDAGLIKSAVEKLQAAHYIYEKDRALWFKSTDFGDEKDRVVIRDNGQGTYFASDIAYHLNKFERGFERIIDVWGADHHGYIARVKAALQALGKTPDQLDILLVQFANLYRGGEKVPMSTRSGSFVTLRELRTEVGTDAARFFYVLRKCEQHMDFDLDLAKSQSSDNPVYYIQYAHARICSVFRQIKEKQLKHDEKMGSENVALLSTSHESALINALAKYPEILEKAAMNEEPHLLAHFLRDLANDLHTYYNAHQFIVEDDALRNARLTLILAARHVLHNALNLLGVSAPESM